ATVGVAGRTHPQPRARADVDESLPVWGRLFDNSRVSSESPKRSGGSNLGADPAAAVRAMPPIDDCLRSLNGRESVRGLSREYLKSVVQTIVDRWQARAAWFAHQCR